MHVKVVAVALAAVGSVAVQGKAMRATGKALVLQSIPAISKI
jgi:hypothetical protein